MITEKDVRRLRSNTSKYYVVGIKYIMPLVGVIVLGAAVGNIYLAIRCANNGNATLRNILSFELDQQYSGWCMAALNRIDLSIFLVTVSLLFVIFWLSGRAEISFAKRMLNFIEFHTNSQETTCSNQPLKEDGPDGRTSA